MSIQNRAFNLVMLNIFMLNIFMHYTPPTTEYKYLFDMILYIPVNSYVGTGLPELDQYYARINVSCSRT